MSIVITPIQKPTVWETPVIVPKPESCHGMENASIRLHTEDEILWKFCMAPIAEEAILAPGMDLPDLTDITVPGNVLMQGFAIQNDTPYYYKTCIMIPQNFAENRVLLRFHGVYSTARVWVNGHPAGGHIGGFTTWDCELTPFVEAGGQAEIVVQFVDVLNDVSIASHYAHYNIGGINRAVELLCIPHEAITRFHAETVFDDAYRDADLRLLIGTTAVSESALLRLSLCAPDGSETELSESELALGGLPAEFCASMRIQSPLKWDSEHPNLYALTARLIINGEEVEAVTRSIGFREITYGGARSTDLNKLYVNGQPVKLRGTCRHDVHPELGRAITPELAEADARMIKASNMNYVRTSHYPPTEEFLDACDRYGIYVEEENAVSFQYTHATEKNFQRGDSRWYVGPFSEMVERDRSHPSVIIWSLGNESIWHAQFQEEYDYLKQTDLSRAAKFSYPDKEALDGVTPCYDIFSMHYIAYNGAMSMSPKPTLHDEYAHVPCYNLGELTGDPNVRSFWGESILKSWENIVNTDGALGGAIWAGIDDIFFIPEGMLEMHQQHSTGSAAGYGEWGNFADVWRREKPEFWMTKKAYSPVRIADHTLKNQTPGEALRIPVGNWFNHTNLSEIRFHWEINSAQGIVSGPDAEPYTEGLLIIPYTEWTADSHLKLCCDTAAQPGEWIDSWELALDEVVLTVPELMTGELPELEETDGAFIVTAGTLRAEFSKETGKIILVEHEGEPVMTGGPHLIADGALTGSWSFESITARVDNGFAYICVTGAVDGHPICFEYVLSEKGMRIDYRHTGETSLEGVQNLGVSFDVPGSADKIDWTRRGYYSVYPDDHIGRAVSSAVRRRPDCDQNPDCYAKRPDWAWKDDMRNFFLYQKDSDANGLATQDFLAMRENIEAYTVHFDGSKSGLTVCSDGSDGAKMQVFRTSNDITDDCFPTVQYSGHDWEKLSNGVCYQSTLHRTRTQGASAEFSFTGDGIRVIGQLNEAQGDFEIVLDGVSRGVYSARSSIGSTLVQHAIFSETELTYGRHTIQLINRGPELVLDALETLDSRRSFEEVTRLAVFCYWNYPNLSWGNYMRNNICWDAEKIQSVLINFTEV